VGKSKNGVWLNLEKDAWERPLLLETGFTFRFNENLGFTVKDITRSAYGTDQKFTGWDSEQTEFYCLNINDDLFMKFLSFTTYFGEIYKEHRKLITSFEEIEKLCTKYVESIQDDFAKTENLSKLRNEFHRKLFLHSKGDKLRLSFQRFYPEIS